MKKRKEKKIKQPHEKDEGEKNNHMLNFQHMSAYMSMNKCVFMYVCVCSYV